ncbi:MAG: Trk system potassium transporter TrkA [Candidatus Marinimicrobia bacterium]|nr:Trk system potassium transporter TrkA [Candidatus Neomarinimicrobiota bacterium]
MNILIVGGGELGSLVAEELIKEKHDLTIIERSEKQVKRLNDELDALIIEGSGTNVSDLIKANVENTDLFLALSNDDNVNIISCGLAKKLSEATTIAKVENYNHYFQNPANDPADFGIDKPIATKQLSIDKIVDLISEPDTIEHIHFIRENVKVIGVEVRRDFSVNGKTLKEITHEDEIWQNVRVVAIKKGNKVRIPSGDDILHTRDKLYIIGKSKVLRKIIDSYFHSGIKVNNIIVIGGNRIGKEFARIMAKNGRKVILLEEDEKVCTRLSEELDNVLVINGSGTNRSVLSELDIENAFVVGVTESDEHNIISAVLAKKYNAFKAICNISNIAISSIINQVQEIDSVFSTELLAVAEIIKYCRRGEILSVTPVPYLDAETIKIKISESVSILDKPLNKIKFPEGMIIGAIIREDDVIIPYGDDVLKLNDIVILFVLPESKAKAEKMFS